MADRVAARGTNQKSRTRKHLLEAASRLMREGRTPTLDEVAQEARVSRATAYRYFSGIEPLLVEAALDVAMPDPATFFPPDGPDDPVARLERLDASVAAMVRTNEPALRTMLMHSLQRGLQGGDALPTRQNRRAPLIEAALGRLRADLSPRERKRLVSALSLVIGTESRLVFTDVLRLGDDEADSIRRWMIAALVGAARRSALGPTS